MSTELMGHDHTTGTSRDQLTFQQPASRKSKLLGVAVGLVVLAVVLGVAIGVPLSRRDAPEDTDLGRAERILKKVPLVDG